MFSSSRINRAGSHFLFKGFGFLAVALSFSMAEAGPRKPTKPVAVDDVWTPQAVSAFNAQQDAFRKTAAGAKAATDFFVPEVLASDLGNIKYAVTADVNNDGWPDVVYAAEFSNEFGIFLNNQTSPATFTRQVLSSNERGASFIVARDLNQDERVDLVLASRFSGTISVWLNAGGGFTPTFERDDVGNVRNASQVEVGHFNNDGALDLVVPSPETSSLVFLLQQPGEQVTFGAPPVELISLEFERFTYAAKNGRPTFVRSIQDTDGPESLVVNYRNSNTVFVFSNLLSTELEPVEPLQAKGTPIVTPDFFEFQLDSVRRPQAIEIADMNDFGFNEIIIAGEAADEIIIYSFDSFFIDQPFPQSPVAKGRIIEQPVTPEYQKTWVTANFEAANRPNVGYADRP
ncbi:MAG: VCBS repeat-containing protein, partial [Candidatus Sumerlaeia bacterium]|nr:VCBS repeat-containing protein [Candidatus Sumerlaeia bacterium]